MEHLHHFKLRLDPFQNEADPRFLVETASFADARRRVDRALRQQKGLVVLTGAAGVGKTVLARTLWESLEEELFEAQMTVIMPGAADAQTVLRRFAAQLGVENPEAERRELLPQVYDQLAVIREDGRQCVFVIDDAHILGPDALAELAGLLQLEYEGKRLFSMLLVGLPELDSALSQHAVTGHRVDVRTRLEPLDPADVSRYLAHRIQIAGGEPPILTPEAVGALGKFGRGRPRLLNSLADNALYEAFLEGRDSVQAYDVERAATDLGIGPDPGDTFVPPQPDRAAIGWRPNGANPAEAAAAPVVEAVAVAEEVVVAEPAPSAAEPALPMADVIPEPIPEVVAEAPVVAQEVPAIEPPHETPVVIATADELDPLGDSADAMPIEDLLEAEPTPPPAPEAEMLGAEPLGATPLTPPPAPEPEPEPDTASSGLGPLPTVADDPFGSEPLLEAEPLGDDEEELFADFLED